MEEYHRHLRLADKIYVLSRQVDSLIEQSHRLKCEKKFGSKSYHFVNPNDTKLYSKYLLLGNTRINPMAVYPSLFKFCMDSVVSSIKYKHPTIKPNKVYYCMGERISDDTIDFFELSDELFYTVEDLKILRSTTEQTVKIMEACVQMYPGRLKHGYLPMMRGEIDRVKRLLD